MESAATVLEETPSTLPAELRALRKAVLSVGRSSSAQLRVACSFLSCTPVSGSVPDAKPRAGASARLPDASELVVQLLLSHNPQGTELRGILAIEQSLREFQCIADAAKSIALAWQELELHSLSHESGQELMRQLSAMKSVASLLVLLSLQAWEGFDGSRVKEAAHYQVKLAENYSSGLRRLVAFVSQEQGNMPQAMALERIFTSLERVGEHAKTVCEQAAYCTGGKRSQRAVRALQSVD